MTVLNFDDLKEHVGHKIVCLRYSEKYVDDEITIECETCHEILYSEFKYCQQCHVKLDTFGRCPNRCQE